MRDVVFYFYFLCIVRIREKSLGGDICGSLTRFWPRAPGDTTTKFPLAAWGIFMKFVHISLYCSLEGLLSIVWICVIIFWCVSAKYLSIQRVFSPFFLTSFVLVLKQSSPVPWHRAECLQSWPATKYRRERAPWSPCGNWWSQPARSSPNPANKQKKKHDVKQESNRRISISSQVFCLTAEANSKSCSWLVKYSNLAALESGRDS